MSKAPLILAGTVLLGGTAAFLIINNARKKKMIATITSILNSDTNSSQTQQTVGNALDPSYFKSQGAGEYGNTDGNSGALILKNNQTVLLRSTVNGIADAIYNSYHYLLPNDSSTVVQKFSLMPSKIAVSYLSYVFTQRHGTSLNDFLNQHFGSSMPEISSIISKLP
jgi:hypothetical protein